MQMQYPGMGRLGRCVVSVGCVGAGAAGGWGLWKSLFAQRDQDIFRCGCCCVALVFGVYLSPR